MLTNNDWGSLYNNIKNLIERLDNDEKEIEQNYKHQLGKLYSEKVRLKEILSRIGQTNYDILKKEYQNLLDETLPY